MIITSHITTGYPVAVRACGLLFAWLYADLVRTYPTGLKREALNFSMKERHEAGVYRFSELAALAMGTLGLIESLRATDALTLESWVWDEEVAIGTSEIVRHGKGFTATEGTPIPDIRDPQGLGKSGILSQRCGYAGKIQRHDETLNTTAHAA